MADGGTSPEYGFKAQQNTFTQITTGERIKGKDQVSLGNEIATSMMSLTRDACAELTDKAGLDADKLGPVLRGKKIHLDPVEKKKLVNYITTTLQVAYLSEDDIGKLLDEADITVHGPIVNISTSGMGILSFQSNVFNMRGLLSGGLSTRLPLARSDDEGVQSSENVFIITTPKDHDSEDFRHEFWHATNAIRSVLYKRMTQEGAYPTVDWLQVGDPEKFLQRLERHFYLPGEVALQMSILQARVPELYDYLVSHEMQSIGDLKKSLLSIQEEIGAHIAGLMADDASGVGQEEMDDIVRRIGSGYGASRFVSLREIGSKLKRGADGKLEWDENKGLPFNKNLAELTGREDKLATLLAKYVGNDGEVAEHFAQDYAHVVNFFMNEGGYGFELRNRVDSQIKHALITFNELAQLRSDSQQALIELSLVPVSHWGAYVNAQRKASTPNEDKGTG